MTLSPDFRSKVHFLGTFSGSPPSGRGLFENRNSRVTKSGVGATSAVVIFPIYRNFRSQRWVTCEQLCDVMVNAAGADLEKVDLSVLDAFPDAADVSDWARPAVAWAVEHGVINGFEFEDGTRELQAGRQLTRAEMAAMTVNAIDAGALVKE